MNNSFIYYSSEKGGVLLIMSVFMTLMLGFMVLSVDGYFQLQSRLEEQNIAEYFSMAAMAGFESEPEEEFVVKRDNAILFLQYIQESNEILGFDGSSGWNFNSNCSGATCHGSNWMLKFGQWQGDDLVVPESEDQEDPDAIDSSLIDACLLELELDTDALIHFFTSSSEGSSINVSSISYIFNDAGGNRVLKNAKLYAGGEALSTQEETQ